MGYPVVAKVVTKLLHIFIKISFIFQVDRLAKLASPWPMKLLTQVRIAA
jgi:hypothetical protein